MPTETQPQSAPDNALASISAPDDLANEEAIRSLLARANLLRMREQWNDAIAACTEAIRRAPRSASAHSLLGEIYEAQGKLDDAAQWFRMALDIDPTNAGDRVRWERLTEMQRVRLRTQDIAAQAANPTLRKEPTLEWIDRIFPPGRADSLPRLILTMSVTFAFLIAVCGGFIYFYILPHHSSSHGSGEGANRSGTMPSDLSLPPPPVVMTPTERGGTMSAASVAGTSGMAKTGDVKSAPTSSAAPKTADTSATTIPDLATLRQRLAQNLNTAQTQLVDVSMGREGMLSLDLALLPNSSGGSAGSASSTDQLREQALRAAALASHAAAGLIPGDSTRVMLRVARVVPAPTGGTAAGGARLKNYEMVFQAETLLRDFRDANLTTLTASDLIARFQNVQWFAGDSSSPSLPTTTGAGTSGSGENGNAAPASSPTPAAGASQTTGVDAGSSGTTGASGKP